MFLGLTEPRTYQAPVQLPTALHVQGPTRTIAELANEPAFRAKLDSMGWEVTDHDSLIAIRTGGGSVAFFDSANQLREVHLSPAAEETARSMMGAFDQEWRRVRTQLVSLLMLFSAIPIALIGLTVMWYRGRTPATELDPAD